MIIARRNLTAQDMAEREELCIDCKFRDRCSQGGIEFCSARDEGEPPEGSEVYSSVTGERMKDARATEEEEATPNEEREIYLESDVTRATVMAIIKKILDINKKDVDIDPIERKPIKLFINCDGGEEVAGNALIDVMEQSLTPIYAIGLGAVYSMAFMVYLAAHKRISFPSTEFLMHDGLCESANNATCKIFDQIDFLKRRNERYKKYVLERTKIEESRYDFKVRDDWYFFTDEAKDLGVVDMIIGDDISYEELYEVS